MNPAAPNRHYLARAAVPFTRPSTRKRTRSPNDAFYSSLAWRVSRKAFLFDHPLCDLCGDVASDVHHRVPIEEGGAKRDPENLRALCRSCHSKVHAQMRTPGWEGRAA